MSEIPITVRGDIDERAVEQLRRCATAGDAVAGVLCADAHVGYSQPIGGAIAYPDHISPSGVGYDIACIAAGTPVVTLDGWHAPIEAVPAAAPIGCWDGTRVRVADPCAGTVARGRRKLLRLTLADGSTLDATGDHEIRTKLGWRRADALRAGDAVARAVFTGLPYETPRGVIEIDAPTRAARLADRGLWPLRAGDERLPALLRLLGTLCGDGHLSRDGKAVSWYTTVADDAEAMADDVRRIGFVPNVHVRARPNGSVEHLVRVSSVDLHSLFAALGCPVGEKASGWPARPMRWLFALPGWLRAQFLSGFASAEATTPATRASGGPANLAIKQAGTTTNAIEFVAEVLTSFGFRVSITASGGERIHVAQLCGGADEQLRFVQEIGFCHAIRKREMAAAILSVHTKCEAVRAYREAAIAAAQQLRGTATVREIVDRVSADAGVPRALIHHGLYGRGTPRVPKGAVANPDHSGEIAWIEVASVKPAGKGEVFDVVTGDPASSFVAGGVVVHNCGNKAARTDVLVEDVRPDLPRVMDEIFERISFGVGRNNAEPVDHPVIDRIWDADFSPQRGMRQMAANQLGTVGAGNHYVDLFAGDDGFVWVGVHFGSRGFGHKTASGFLALAAGRGFKERGPDGEMDSPPVLLAVDSELGQSYIAAMSLAGEYAYAGRDIVVDKVLEILGANATYEVHNHHNFAWRERHHGTDVWVIRKGCTPAFPGQEGFVGATMGEPSVILRGTDAPDGEALLYSTVHGAGRVMSRTQAAGRVGNRAECGERDCDFWVTWRQHQTEGTHCPRHPHAQMIKRRGRIKTGLIDFDEVRAGLRAGGIELRGGAADEAPGAYKRLDAVLAAHGDTVEVLHRLEPIGVAMAGADTFDPYKD